MYNLEIGRRVLALYNKDKPQALTAKAFFDEVMFPVFFDTDDDPLHLMQVGNSSFFQAYPQKDRKAGKSLGAHKHERHQLLVADVAAGKKAVSGAIAVGYPASGPAENTAGQVSHIRQLLDAETIALTWIGAASGIGLAGGVNILIDNADILDHIMNGWSYYRRFLDENTTFKGRQIETWNGLWLVYGFGAPDLEESFRRLMDKLPEHQGVTAKKESNLAERPDWFRMFLNLANNGSLPERMQAYAYKFGQMNTTLGFLNIELQPVKNLRDIFSKILHATYPDQYGYSDGQEELRKIFQAHYTLADMIALGGISIRTLRPAKVEAFMKENKPSKSDNNPNYKLLIKSWIIAMLNNDELADLARDLGLALRNIETNSRETATTKIEALLNAASKAAFINAANDLKEHKGVIDAKETAKEHIDAAVQVLKKAENAVQRKIPSDQLQLFKALTKSDYLMCKFHSSN